MYHFSESCFYELEICNREEIKIPLGLLMLVNQSNLITKG